MKKPKVKELELKIDSRGKLFEIIRKEDVGQDLFGQVTLTTARINETKGRHYHLRKTEWYCVVKGKARLRLRNNSSNESIEVTLSSRSPKLVEIPPNWYHEITNISREEMYLIVYCDESFDENDPDTYYL